MRDWVVMSDWPEEGSLEFFPTQDEAAAYVKKIIKAAEEECDVDGYPNFINEVLVLQVRGEVQNSRDGLGIEWRKPCLPVVPQHACQICGEPMMPDQPQTSNFKPPTSKKE